jgi:hypothetical protein
MILNRLGFALILGGIQASAAQAEVIPFQVVLAGSVLGTLQYETGEAGRPVAVRTNLDNTPLGVFDGTWEATSRPVQTEAGAVVLQYISTSASTRKNRVISVLHADGQVVETVVSPANDATEMSQAAQVPAGVVDPVEAFGRLADAAGCPEPFRIYDGRRVVEVATVSSEQAGDVLTCRARYEVILGPGLLSPFRFNSFDMELTYALVGLEPVLAEARVDAGMFSVSLVR